MRAVTAGDGETARSQSMIASPKTPSRPAERSQKVVEPFAGAGVAAERPSRA